MYLLPNFLSSQGTYFRDYTFNTREGTALRCFDIQRVEGGVSAHPVGSKRRIEVPNVRIIEVIDNDTGEFFSPDNESYLSEGSGAIRQRSSGRSRRADKAVLEKLFRYPIIRHFYRFRLVEEFGFRCFNCSAPARLIEVQEKFSHISGGVLRFANIDIDHHFPFELGGALEYGNLVPLCKTCNSAKLDLDPRIFYCPEKLETLTECLNRQREEFDFELEWDYLNARMHREYFEKIGIPPHLIDHALNSEDHDYFIF